MNKCLNTHAYMQHSICSQFAGPPDMLHNLQNEHCLGGRSQRMKDTAVQTTTRTSVGTQTRKRHWQEINAHVSSIERGHIPMQQNNPSATVQPSVLDNDVTVDYAQHLVTDSAVNTCTTSIEPDTPTLLEQMLEYCFGSRQKFPNVKLDSTTESVQIDQGPVQQPAKMRIKRRCCETRLVGLKMFFFTTNFPQLFYQKKRVDKIFMTL